MTTEGPDLTPLYDSPGLATLVAEQDMVCNSLVALERNEARSKMTLQEQSAVAARRLGQIVIASVIFFPALAVYLGIAYLQCQVWILWVATVVALGEALAFFPFILGMISRMSTDPTNVMLSSFGFAFKWCLTSDRGTTWFPWHSVSRAYVTETCIDTTGPLGPAVVLELDTSKLSTRLKYYLYVDCCTLWLNMPNPWKRNSTSNSRALPIRIPLLAFTLESDQLRLLNVIRSNLSEDAVDQSIIERLEQTVAPTFTQLWLDDAQSFRRQRTEPLLPGARLQDRYVIEEFIAGGGQATVYKGLDTSTVPYKRVALKEFVLPVNAGTDVRDRSFTNVKNEALLLGQLNHPGIVRLLDNFVEDHRAYLVMENIDGQSLKDAVVDGKPFAIVMTVGIAIQLCDILSYLHELSPPVVHRDFTPDNLMLAGSGLVKLLDFNVAKQLESTSTQTVVGKHNYIAPEQFKGKPCPQSDLYSLGATVFFLATGTDPVPLSRSELESDGDGSRQLSEIISRLTDLDLDKRYKTAREVRSDLAILVNNHLAV